MKKIISTLIISTLLLSLSISAFAVNSPNQNINPAPAVVDGWENPDTDADKSSAEEQDALRGEKETARKISDAEGTDENNEKIIIALGEPDPATATEQMTKDAETLIDSLVLAKKALSQNEQGIIRNVFNLSGAENGKPTAQQPFRAVASKYPVTVKIRIDNPDDFLGMMIWRDGRFMKLNSVLDKEASTVTFVLERPSIVSLCYNTVEAP